MTEKKPLPAAYVSEKGDRWHQRFLALFKNTSVDIQGNPVVKLLTVGTDKSTWKPELSPNIKVNYSYLPEMLSDSQILALARRELTRYMSLKYVQKRDSLKQKYGDLWIDQKITQECESTFNQDIETLRVFDLKDKTTILGGASCEFDFTERCIKALPWLFSEEQRLLKMCRAVPDWGLIEPPSMDRFAQHMIQICCKSEDQQDGKVQASWLRDMEKTLGSDTSAVGVSAIINREIVFQWDELVDLTKDMARRLEIFVAQEFSKMAQSYSAIQAREAKVPEVPVLIPRLASITKSQVTEQMRRLDLAARRMGQLAVVCDQLKWLFRPTSTPPLWPLEEDSRLDRSGDTAHKFRQSMERIRQETFHHLVHWFSVKTRKALEEEIKENVGMMAVKFLDPAKRAYFALWEKNKKDRDGIGQQFTRVHSELMSMVRHLTGMDVPVISDELVKWLFPKPIKFIKNKIDVLPIHVPLLLEKCSTEAELAVAQVDYFEKRQYSSWKELIELWISQQING